MASVGEKHWRGFQSYINDTGGVEGDNSDRWQKSGDDDDEWERWDTKSDENTNANGTTDNGWDDAGWNSTEWDTSKSKPEVNNSFSKKDTSSNGWDNVDMDQWDSEDWTPSKQRTKGD